MDYEARMALEGSQAASEAQLDRDMRDLELLRKIREHGDLPTVTQPLKHDADCLRAFVVNGDAPVSARRMALLDMVVALISPSDEKAGGQ